MAATTQAQVFFHGNRAAENNQRCAPCLGRRMLAAVFFWDYDLELLVQGGYITVKGQSRSDSLLLSPYHWAKLFRGVVAIVAVPMRFAVIC